jgi:hypothetical protein
MVYICKYEGLATKGLRRLHHKNYLVCGSRTKVPMPILHNGSIVCRENLLLGDGTFEKAAWVRTQRLF